MSLTIYPPQGAAREYSPLALNIYQGCDHGCWYCYVPRMRRRFNPQYDHTQVSPRRDLIKSLRRGALKFANTPHQVLLSFTGDPYCRADVTHTLTREVLEILLKHRIPVAILSKGGERMLRDEDLFKKFGPSIKIGTTLVYMPPQDDGSGAGRSQERITTLAHLKSQGIPTWVSFEPVVDPHATLNYLELCHHWADHVKLGKLNHHPMQEARVDWREFLRCALEILRARRIPFYIKKSLQAYSDGLDLTAQEIDPDHLNVTPFSHDGRP